MTLNRFKYFFYYFLIFYLNLIDSKKMSICPIEYISKGRTPRTISQLSGLNLGTRPNICPQNPQTHDNCNLVFQKPENFLKIEFQKFVQV